MTPREAFELIVDGREIPGPELVALLCRESRKERFEANAALAAGYLQADQLEKAADYAERAWYLSGFAETYLPAYKEILTARGDIERIRQAYKRIGMQYVAAGNVAKSIQYFNLSHYASQQAGRGDQYEYDIDILNAVEHLGRLSRLKSEAVPFAESNSRIRLAYLVFGASHQESVLIKLLCYFARYHDPSGFDVRFFIPDTPDHESARRNVTSNAEKLVSSGGSVIAARGSDHTEGLLDISSKLVRFQPQLLVTAAALADYSHYFIAGLGVSSARIALVYGPPEQYVPPNFDWVIAATKHPLMDSPVDGSVVPIEVDLPDPAKVPSLKRSTLSIPDNATVIVIAGRPEKLLNRAYWNGLSNILTENENTYLVIVGLSEFPEFVGSEVAAAACPRLRLLAYRSDYQQALKTADIVLDTFPSGGGVVLLDAMALGLPVVTFRNDYSKKFDQTRWSPGEELLEVDELIVPNGNYKHLARLIGKLITDPDYRHRMGTSCQASVSRLRGQPDRMVRQHERIYRAVLEKRARGERPAIMPPPLPIGGGSWNNGAPQRLHAPIVSVAKRIAKRAWSWFRRGARSLLTTARNPKN